MASAHGALCSVFSCLRGQPSPRTLDPYGWVSLFGLVPEGGLAASQCGSVGSYVLLRRPPCGTGEAAPGDAFWASNVAVWMHGAGSCAVGYVLGLVRRFRLRRGVYIFRIAPGSVQVQIYSPWY